MARPLLRDGQLAVPEVGFLLGYQDPAVGGALAACLPPRRRLRSRRPRPEICRPRPQCPFGRDAKVLFAGDGFCGVRGGKDSSARIRTPSSPARLQAIGRQRANLTTKVRSKVARQRAEDDRLVA